MPQYTVPLFTARGRIAWYCAIGLGLVLLVLGLVLNQLWLTVAGIAFMVFGGVFLVLSYVTHGRTD